MSERKTLKEFQEQESIDLGYDHFQHVCEHNKMDSPDYLFVKLEALEDFHKQEIKAKDAELKQNNELKERYYRHWQLCVREIESFKQQIKVNDQELDVAHRTIFELQHDLKEVKQQLSEREWISVDDRLPEKETRVLCIGNHASHCIDYWSDASYAMGLFQTAGNFKISHTHWQPLTQPPIKQ